MGQTRKGALGSPGALQWATKPLNGSKPFLDPRQNAEGVQSEPQELQKRGPNDGSHLDAASHEQQSTSGTSSSLNSPGGANPVSAASHASAASLNSNGAQPRPISFALPPLANRQPQKGVALNSNRGQHNAFAVPAASVAPASAGTAAPQTRHPAARHSTQTASSADAHKSLPSLITSGPAVNGRVGSDTSRQLGSSGDGAHGSATSQSPVGQLSANSPPVSKPILKMKRTGQNFPISSSRSSSPLRMHASLHQRKAPSPNIKTVSIPRTSCSSSKTPEIPEGRGVGVPTAVNGSTIGETNGSSPSTQPPTNCKANASDCQYRSADVGHSNRKIEAWALHEGIEC